MTAMPLRDYQPIVYPDKEKLEHVCGQLKQYPPLVSEKIVLSLKAELAAIMQQLRPQSEDTVDRGVPDSSPDSLLYHDSSLLLEDPVSSENIAERDLLNRSPTHIENAETFVLQLGYCAERFSDATEDVYAGFLSLLRECESMLSSFHLSLLSMLRMAGQYAKPRSSFVEKCDPCVQQSVENCKKCTIAYRGDLVNGEPCLERLPDANRLIEGYESAQKCMSLLSGLSDRAVYTMHEALCLPFEQGLLREHTELARAPFDAKPASISFASSAACLWLGERTARLDSVHLGFLEGITNPIGIKLGPNTTGACLIAMLDRLNPRKECGKIMLITRLGVSYVGAVLPGLIRAVEDSKHPVLWLCDPMHGNTETILLPPASKHPKLKIRHFDTIMEEALLTFSLHRTLGSRCSGLHLEVSEDPFTRECLGGLSQPILLDETFLALTHYTTACDPRLNPSQTRDLLHCLLSN